MQRGKRISAPENNVIWNSLFCPHFLFPFPILLCIKVQRENEKPDFEICAITCIFLFKFVEIKVLGKEREKKKNQKQKNISRGHLGS